MEILNNFFKKICIFPFLSDQLIIVFLCILFFNINRLTIDPSDSIPAVKNIKLNDSFDGNKPLIPSIND